MTINEEWFKKLRFDDNHHLGLGDIRLTIGQQEEILAALAEKEREIRGYEQRAMDADEAMINDEFVLKEQIAALTADLAEKDKTPDFARGFNAGKNATLRRNPSGCCCKFTDEKEGEDIISLCAAHKEYIEAALAEKDKAILHYEVNACPELERQIAALEKRISDAGILKVVSENTALTARVKELEPFLDLGVRQGMRIKILEAENAELTDCLNGSSKAVYTAEMYDKLRDENADLKARIQGMLDAGRE
jgi:hypothetical protein